MHYLYHTRLSHFDQRTISLYTLQHQGLTVRVGTPEATDPGDDSSSDGEPTGATPLSLSLPGDGVSTGDLTVYSSSANCPACKVCLQTQSL